MKSTLIRLAHYIDSKVAFVGTKIKKESPNLIILLFHELFEHKAECEKDSMFPHEWLTVDHFRQFVIHFLEAGYTFISPDQVKEDLSPEGRYVMISFDDGYYNNQRALPILREFEVPAIFSIASDYIKHPRAFWWDVHYREERKKGKSFRTLLEEQQDLKKLTFSEVENHLKGAYGQKAFDSCGDTDRPFTVEELKDFANEKFVYIGNHSRHHAILPNYDLETVESEIQGAQDDLEEILGKAPNFIAYPNGEANPEIVQIADKLGLETGVIACLNKQTLPLQPKQFLQLDRYQIFGTRNIDQQCLQLRADISLRKMYQKLRNAV